MLLNSRVSVIATSFPHTGQWFFYGHIDSEKGIMIVFLRNCVLMYASSRNPVEGP